MVLRAYQEDCVAAVQRGWPEWRRQLVVMPTGAGKTVVFARLAALAKNDGQRTLVLAHREELIDQAMDKLWRSAGVRADKEKAEHHASSQACVVVASIQTMLRRGEEWAADHFGLVVVDEAHHALADSYQRVLGRFQGHARILGVTATPDRGDRRNLGAYFENVAFEVGLFDLVRQGFLSPIAVKSIPLAIDLNGVKSVAGDFAEADLGAALEPYLGRIAAAIREQASFRRVLAFLPLRVTSRKFVAACREAGLRAEHVDGESADRAEILHRFHRWEFDVLSNAMLLTEGFDDPGIDCVVVLRPTRSRPLYAQMVGRGTRVTETKENLLLLDFLWMHERHRLARPASLVAASEAEQEIITRLSQESKGGGGEDLAALAGAASAEREKALRKQLEALRGKPSKYISADEFALQFHQPELADWEATMPWESEGVTEKQEKYLRRAGIDLSTVKNKGHASQLLGVYFQHKPVVAASAAQRWRLRQMGCPDWQTATDAEARRWFAGRRG